MSNQVVVPASRRKALRIVALGAVLVAAGFFLVRLPGPWIFLLGAITIGFGSVFGIYALYRVIRPGIAVEVDDQGLVDGASAAAVGRIGWDEIDDAYIYGVMGQTMLGIVPRDLEGFLQRQPWWRRVIIRANRGLGYAPINIPEVILSSSANEVFTAMERISGKTWPTRHLRSPGPPSR